MNVVRNATSVYKVNANGTYSELMASGPKSNITCLPESSMNYDYEGAMKFTVAVVLVYGVGIIGLLGIYTKKKRSAEDKIKEGDNFIRTFERKRHLIERKSRKSEIAKLVHSVQGIEPKSPTSIIGKLALNPVINIALPPRASINFDKINLKRQSIDTENIEKAENIEIGKICPPEKRVTFESDSVTCDTRLLSPVTTNTNVKSNIIPSEYSIVCEDGKPVNGSRRNAIRSYKNMNNNDRIATIHGSDSSTRDYACDRVKPNEHDVPRDNNVLDCVPNNFVTMVTDKKFISILQNESYV
ncbi:hypothetical protein LOTGIDRAFT_152109 [Lottia gigantea]|uniref:Uncharacterized protein n=1 Tax=Lottia gigantea TaxID=225164 RepID=V4CRX8_LOTGI|nr:hypothetical protein LOTGIDRAFT_152109 [Lottia gigantea]ESP05280.1 hypothetical protein LOTGIDRAFT_152109 [Lottia gigantea]